MIPKCEDLVSTRQRPHEPFGEYVGRWRTLASQARDRPSDEESIEIIIRGAQPDIGGLLSIQPITTFSSLIRVDARVEGSLRSGSFPTLSAFAKSNNGSSSNNSGNNNPRRGDPSKPSIAYVQSHATPINMVAQLGLSKVIYAPTRRTHTTQDTTTIRPVHHVAPTRQGRQLGERRPYRKESEFTPLPEPLNAVFPKVASLLEFLEIRPPPDPP